MYVLNKEKRLIILGDGIRQGSRPGAGTKLFPGKGVSLDEVPKAQRTRFVECVKAQIARGRDLEIMDSAPLSSEAANELEKLRVQKNLDKLAALTGEKAEEKTEEKADEEKAPKPTRRTRTRKEPLGGE